MITELDKRMKQLEILGDVTVELDKFFVIRLDGRGFSSMTEKHFIKPFDDLFFKIMDDTTDALVTEFDAAFAFTQSDEISLLFPKAYSLFDRRVEKLLSLTSAHASAVFSIAFTQPVMFDARLISFSNMTEIHDYFRWRTLDGSRNALNTCFYWTNRKAGSSPVQVTKLLQQSSAEEKRSFLGGTWTDQPLRNVFGSFRSWVKFEKIGYNPKLQQTEIAERKKLVRHTGSVLPSNNIVLSSILEEHSS